MTKLTATPEIAKEVINIEHLVNEITKIIELFAVTAEEEQVL